MVEMDRSTLWALMCESTKSHAATMCQSVRPEFAALIEREARLFYDRAPPATEEETGRRHQQSLHLNSKIGSIVHADSMARSAPLAAARILEALTAFLDDIDINEAPHDRSITLMSTISDLCHA